MAKGFLMTFTFLGTVDTIVEGGTWPPRMCVAASGRYLCLISSTGVNGLVLRRSINQGVNWSYDPGLHTNCYHSEHYDLSKPAPAGTYANRIIAVWWDYGSHTLWDDDKTWTTDEYNAGYLCIDGGTGDHEGTIVDNGNWPNCLRLGVSYLTHGWVDTPGGVRPANDSTYKVWKYGTDDDHGVAEAATANTLTDTDKAWVVNTHAGKYVLIWGGSGKGQWRHIVSNTATQLTVSPNWSSPSPAQYSNYCILDTADADDSGTADRTDAILVRISTDNGVSWQDPIVAVSDPLDTCDVAISWPGADQLLICYQKSTETTIRGRKSTDGGATWANTTTNPTAQGTMPILQDDRLYYRTSLASTHVYTTRTTDGGDTWSAVSDLGFDFGATLEFDAERSEPHDIQFYVRPTQEGAVYYVHGSVSPPFPGKQVDPFVHLVDDARYPTICPLGATSQDLMGLVVYNITDDQLDFYKGSIDWPTGWPYHDWDGD